MLQIILEMYKVYIQNSFHYNQSWETVLCSFCIGLKYVIQM